MGKLTHTVKGPIASFRSADKAPIESLKLHFLPKQEGSGDPSPTNIRPITGWTGVNGRRAGKNIGRIVGYSTTSMNSPTATRNLTNTYGTTINTTNFTLPDTSVVITQSETGAPESKASYKNGYICIGFDNLIFDKYYDVSFKVTDIISNPLNADLRNINLLSPSGGQALNKEIINGNTILIKNVQYTRNSNNPNRCNFEIRNCGMSCTISEFMVTPANTSDGIFEPYSGELIPIIFPDGQTIYGGYIDPVAGEIVAEYAIDGSNGSTWGIGNSRVWQWNHAVGKNPANYFKSNLCTHWINNKHTYYQQDDTTYVNENGALCIGKDVLISAGLDFENITSSQIEEYLTQQENNGTPFRVCFPLETPIHIPIAPQDLKAFLDHNNFWSDANDITEVTYAVTESKDILATRKKAMAFDHAHHKKVKWNQLVKELTLDYWKPYNDVNTLTANNGELTLTLNEISSTTYRNSIITDTSARTNCITGHKYYFIYYFCPSWNTYGIGFSILNQNSPVYPQAYANTYAKCSGICVHSGSSGKHNIMLAYSGWDKSWTVGSTIKCKTPIMVDMTRMFGEGNEPSTTDEFEHICEINGIDLTTYQPYDEGSDRWLIVP